MNEEKNVPDNVPAPKPAEHQPLNAEQILEVERLRSERAKYEAEGAKAQIEIDRTKRENAAILQRQALGSAFRAAGVRFHTSQEETLRLLDGEIEYDENHAPRVNGKPLEESLKALALSRPDIADGRSTRSLKPAEEQQTKIQSKADFQSVKERVDFINMHGEAAFATLPPRRPRIVEVRTFEDFQGLPMVNKTKLIAEHGPDWAARLPREQTDATRNRRAGILTNKVTR